jgi:hypothetical protein
VAQRTLPEGRYGKQARKPLPKWLRWLPVLDVEGARLDQHEAPVVVERETADANR